LAEVPVLAVKDYQSIGLQSNLLLMVELKDYSKEAIRSISQFATLLDMNVHIVYIKTHAGLISDNVSEHIKTFAKNNNFKKFTTSVAEIDGDLDQINTLAKRVSADVIACVSEGDSGLIRFIFGSDTEKILNETNLPVLAVSDK
ncbi:MAG: universal stress protein, partial [Fulvivirga sp.]